MKKLTTKAFIAALLIFSMSVEVLSLEEGMPMSLPRHYNTYEESPFSKINIDGKDFAKRIRLKQGPQTYEFEQASSGAILTNDEFDRLFSSSIEDIIKRNGSELKNLRLLEQIKGLIYRINRRTYKYSYLSRSPIEKLTRLVSNGKISEIITELTDLEEKNPPHNSSMSSEYEPCDTELPENVAALKTALEKIPDKEQTFKNFAETTVREFDTSKVVVYEIHDPRLSYILNYDAKDNATIDEFKPNLIESSDILNRLKDPSTRKQFRKEHHLSPKALISILEHDLFVAKNRVALHLVEALSNIIWNMYEDSTSYETKSKKSETASTSSRNAGGGRLIALLKMQ